MGNAELKVCQHTPGLLVRYCIRYYCNEFFYMILFVCNQIRRIEEKGALLVGLDQFDRHLVSQRLVSQQVNNAHDHILSSRK